MMAVGAMALLGRRVPFGLKIMLLSLAIADDIGAVVVIAAAAFVLINLAVDLLYPVLDPRLRAPGVSRGRRGAAHGGEPAGPTGDAQRGARETAHRPGNGHDEDKESLA